MHSYPDLLAHHGFILPETMDAADWKPHPTFTGVFLRSMLPYSSARDQVSLMLVRIQAGYAIGRHVHEAEMEIHQVVSGEGICRLDGRDLSYAPGCLALLDRGLPHAVHAESEMLILATFIRVPGSAETAWD